MSVGSSIAGHQNLKRTAIAIPLGGGRHLKHAQFTHVMTIGTNGFSRRGFGQNYGELQPRFWGGYEIKELYSISPGDTRIEFVGDIQLPTVNSFYLTTSIPGRVGGLVVWNGDIVRYDGPIVPEVFDYLDSNIGGKIMLTMRRVD